MAMYIDVKNYPHTIRTPPITITNSLSTGILLNNISLLNNMFLFLLPYFVRKVYSLENYKIIIWHELVKCLSYIYILDS